MEKLKFWIGYFVTYFGSVNELELSPGRICCEGDYSIIEFSLLLGDKTIRGTDIIRWEGEKILELRAYFDTSSGVKKSPSRSKKTRAVT